MSAALVPSRDDLAYLSIEQAARLLRKKEISPVELVETALARIARGNPSLNAFLTVLAERARREAKFAERAFRRGNPRSPLFGIPISLKDNFWTRGVRSTAGSKILGDFTPEKDSEVARLLAEAGAILLGKTNMHEFAYGITNENPHYGPVHNPWAHDRISGGSSGGSAAAVATGMGFASMGTDTGGSIRIPAALCGITGLKPTHGLVSVEGVLPLVESMDHAGPLARSVKDACIMLETVAGKYPKGAQTLDHRRLGKHPKRRFRLGRPKEYFFERVDAGVREAIDAAAKCFISLGARIEELSLRRLDESVEASANVALAEAALYHISTGYFPGRKEEYSGQVAKRLEMGHEVRAVDYLNSLAVLCGIKADFQRVFERVDAILAPAVPIPAPRIGENEVEVAGEKETVRSALVRLNRPANFTGNPAISVPCGFTSAGLPVGLQLIGPHWGEARLLEIAQAYESATEWHKRHPDL